MCGFAGVVRSRPGDPVAWLQRSAVGLRHRGPDDEGYWLLDADGRCSDFSGADSAVGVPHARVGESADAVVGLVHRRLAIIDPSARGHQPMTAPSGVTLIFNGEVYNYRELRVELELEGVRFTSLSDTEVVLAAYDQWGPAAFRRFVGMWALAIVDPDRRQLVLSRDPFGIKPLYYARSSDELVFASEIEPLLDVGWVDSSPDLDRVEDFLRSAQSDDGERTFHAGVRQVPAATYVEIPLDLSREPVSSRYWSIDPTRQLDVSFHEAVEMVRSAFVESVELHVRSDVPVGACLSGGIDSSAIVCAMREIGGADLDLHTFSYISSDPAISEESWIRIVNRRVGSNGHAVRIDPADFGRDLPLLGAAQHEPFLSTSAYAQYRVFEQAGSAGVKVLLDGQGADELLAGYRGYRSVLLRHAVRDRAPVRALRLAYGLARTSSTGRNDLAEVARSAVRRWRGRPALDQRDRSSVAAATARLDSLRDLLVEAVQTSSLPALLRYEDRNSMAHSVESRVPFLTTHFAELVLGLPPQYLVSSSGMTKHVFRSAMRGLVPDQVLDRRDKIGFAPTETLWLAHAPLLPLPDAPESVEALIPPHLRDWAGSASDRTRPDAEAWRAWSVLDWASRSC